MDISKAFPGWHIVEEIGSGGFGKVYKIEKNDPYGKTGYSAMKVISVPENSQTVKDYRDDGYDDVSITAIFRNKIESIKAELEIMAKLRGNSNIVSYEDHAIIQHEYDPGWDVFIRMELLQTLPEYYSQNFAGREIPENEVISLGIDICKALEVCQKNGITHRDIKPQNIFVNDNGDYKLGDFGIARELDHTTKATKSGTYGYMAPEVYFGKPYNSGVDLYSLGLVMYWMLNERRGPFQPLPPIVPLPTEIEKALERRFGGETLPKPMHGSEELASIVLRACAFEPAERFSSPAEMRDALERLRAGVAPLEPVLIRFLNTDGSVIQSKKYQPGQRIVAPKVPAETEKNGVRFLFDKWFPALDETATVTMDYRAAYRKENIAPEPPAPPKWRKYLPIAAACLVLILAGGILAAVHPWTNKSEEAEQDPTVESVDQNQETDLKDHTSDIISVQEITLSSTELTLVMGQTSQLAATVFPSDAEDFEVEWAVKNPSIVRVENGVVTALKSGSTIIMAKAGNISTECVVSVMDREVERIEIARKASKDTYFVGDTLDTSGLELEVSYNDGETERVTSGFGTDYNFSEGGARVVTITYGNESTTYTVNVKALSLEAISIATLPSKTNLLEGETLNTSGLSINLLYNNGDEKTVTSGFECSPTTFSSAGAQTVNVSYEGKTTNFSVNISALSKYSITVMPSNKIYGTVSVSKAGPYKEGEEITITASPYNGCLFYGWSDGNTSKSRNIRVSKTETYTAVFYGPVSDWTTSVPNGAMKVAEKTQYRYQDKQYTTSSASSLSGWTQYDSSFIWGPFGPYSDWSTSPVASNESTDVETRLGYHYYYYLCEKCGMHMHGYGTNACYTWAGGCGADISSNAYHAAWSGKAYSQTEDWHGTGVRYAYIEGDELAFAYTSATSPHYLGPVTQYRYATREKIFTYYYYKWGEFSAWSDTKYQNTDDRKVESRVVYQYRQD